MEDESLPRTDRLFRTDRTLNQAAKDKLDLSGADPVDARIDGADLEGANVEGTVLAEPR